MTGSPGSTLTYPRMRPRRGAVRVDSWWAKAWLRAVEESSFGGEEARPARRIARAGDVGSISIEAGRAYAAVDERDETWTVELGLPVLDEAGQELVVELVAAVAGRIAALTSGQLPHQLVEELEESGVELLPYGGEIDAACACDAWLSPCVHAVAVLHQLGWMLDRDPFVLLTLRGLPRAALLARLHDAAPSGGTSSGAGPGAGAGTDAESALAADLDLAHDAALLAARMLAALDRPAPEDPADVERGRPGGT